MPRGKKTSGGIDGLRTSIAGIGAGASGAIQVTGSSLPRSVAAAAPARIRGIRWPFEFQAGRVRTSDNDQHIMESVKQIIAVGKGEYVMIPGFGSTLYRRVFEPANLVPLITSDLREAIRQWEPRVSFLRAAADFDHAAEGVISIDVEVVMRGDAQPMSTNVTVRR